MISHLCAAGFLLQNRDVGRRYRTWMAMVRSWIGFSFFPNSFGDMSYRLCNTSFS